MSAWRRYLDALVGDALAALPDADRASATLLQLYATASGFAAEVLRLRLRCARSVRTLRRLLAAMLPALDDGPGGRLPWERKGVSSVRLSVAPGLLAPGTYKPLCRTKLARGSYYWLPGRDQRTCSACQIGPTVSWCCPGMGHGGAETWSAA
jgi:hypothetical protein